MLPWSELHGDEIIILAPKVMDREERRIPIMPALAKILERPKVGPDGRELASEPLRPVTRLASVSRVVAPARGGTTGSRLRA
jgi:hypothetical protein